MKAACSPLSRLRESDPHVYCPVYCGSLIRLFNNNVIVLLISVRAWRSLRGKLFLRLEILTSASSVLTSSKYDSRVIDS